MILVSFLIGGIVYLGSATLVYQNELKQHPWLYFGIGLTLALVANLMWLSIAKHTENASQLYLYGFWWDSLIIGSYALVPVLFYGVRPAPTSIIGIILILVGIYLTK